MAGFGTGMQEAADIPFDDHDKWGNAGFPAAVCLSAGQDARLCGLFGLGNGPFRWGPASAVQLQGLDGNGARMGGRSLFRCYSFEAPIVHLRAEHDVASVAS